MRALDFLDPLPVHDATASLVVVVNALRAGVPVAYADGGTWRLVRPTDVLAYPTTRQLCDLPSVELPTLEVTEEVGLDQLARNHVWGAVKNAQLVGRVDSARVLSELAMTPRDSEELLAGSARDRLMPKLLHDLANALSVPLATRPDPGGNNGSLAHFEGLRHAAALVAHMRALFAQRGDRAEDELPIGSVLSSIEPMLRVAARPAALMLTSASAGAFRGQRWRLVSALLNLVLNASELADVVRLSTADIDQTLMEVLVEDNGPGFDDDTTALGRESSRSELHGHGLPSIHRQIGALGGRVQLARSVLGGALVRIQLPRTR